MLLIVDKNVTRLVWRCGQHLAEGKVCRAPATYEFQWPGAEHRPICPHHCARAWYIANTMGFELAYRSLPPINEIPTDDPETRRWRLLEVD